MSDFDDDFHAGARMTEEVAEQEIDRFLEEMDIDVDRSGMDDDDLAGYKRARRTLVKAMTAGRLIVNDQGEPVYTPHAGGDPITFHEPTGATYAEMDRKKSGQDVGKMMAIMGGMTKESPARFANLPNRDFRVCQAITTLFLG